MNGPYRLQYDPWVKDSPANGTSVTDSELMGGS